MCGCDRSFQSQGVKEIGLSNSDELEVININASISVKELVLGIQEVRKIDDRAILEVRQWPDEINPSNSDAEIFKLKRDGFRYLIIETGEIRGLLDGGGKVHCLRWDNGKWLLFKTVGWVS